MFSFDAPLFTDIPIGGTVDYVREFILENNIDMNVLLDAYRSTGSV